MVNWNRCICQKISSRDHDLLVNTNSYLRKETGHRTLDTAPFAMNHSSLSESDNNVLMARRDQFSCYLTSPRQVFWPKSIHDLSFRMLLGVDVAGFQQIILVRPPNLLHSVVQVIHNCLISIGKVVNFHLYRLWAEQEGSRLQDREPRLLSMSSSTRRCRCVQIKQPPSPLFRTWATTSRACLMGSGDFV